VNAKDHEELLQYMVDNNSAEFNFNKALEESSEFSEALLKYQTKHPDNPKRPAREEILKEYGDFMYRGMISLRVIFKDKTLDEIAEMVRAHMENKLERLAKWRAEGKYKGGL
jgi:hypothetical protein